LQAGDSLTLDADRIASGTGSPSVTADLFAELRRRNVSRAAFYVDAVWALTQGIAQPTPVGGALEWRARGTEKFAAIGRPRSTRSGLVRASVLGQGL